MDKEIPTQFESKDANDAVMMKTSDGIPCYVVGKVFSATPLRVVHLESTEDKTLRMK